jgi:hypothetical protein
MMEVHTGPRSATPLDDGFWRGRDAAGGDGQYGFEDGAAGAARAGGADGEPQYLELLQRHNSESSMHSNSVADFESLRVTPRSLSHGDMEAAPPATAQVPTVGCQIGTECPFLHAKYDQVYPIGFTHARSGRGVGPGNLPRGIVATR